MSTIFRSNYDSDDKNEYRMKIDSSCWNGQLKLEEFLNWLAKGERFFEYTKIRKEK